MQDFALSTHSSFICFSALDLPTSYLAKLANKCTHWHEVPYLHCSSNIEHSGYVLEANDKSDDTDRNAVGNNDFLKGVKVTWEKSPSMFHYKIHFSRKPHSEHSSMPFILPLMQKQVSKTPANIRGLYFFIFRVRACLFLGEKLIYLCPAESFMHPHVLHFKIKSK